MDLRWRDVNKELPTREGWYLVWAPRYTRGSSSSSREVIEGRYMFVKFRPNYKFQWAIECQYDKNLVEFWMPLPESPNKEVL